MLVIQKAAPTYSFFKDRINLLRKPELRKSQAALYHIRGNPYFWDRGENILTYGAQKKY